MEQKMQWSENVILVDADFLEFLSEKAFKDRLGEFSLGSFPIEDIVSRGEFMNDALKAAMESDKTQHILVMADMDAYGTQICKTANGETKAQVTLFTMRLIPSGKYKQQILGYSVMSGLGIRSDELK